MLAVKMMCTLSFFKVISLREMKFRMKDFDENHLVEVIQLLILLLFALVDIAQFFTLKHKGSSSQIYNCNYCLLLRMNL